MTQRISIAKCLALALVHRAPLSDGSAAAVSDILQSLDAVKGSIDGELFLYKSPAHQWVPSTVYRYDDFRASIGVMATEGVAGKRFYVGESGVENGHVYGLVNIAAFLAQSMKETIQYDACDENSWDLVGGKYPLSNACGQLGQSYQDYRCPPEEAHMECPVDPDMSVVGVTHAKWYGAPGPLFCGPKTEERPFSGFWDHIYECNKSWATPPETCDAYEDQKAGRYDHSQAHANTAGRTDVEGCCWWGRGVIQTSGVCNFGKLNYYLGAGAERDGRPAKYPTIDFCKDPEAICASSEYKELKWIAGEFYWMESLQTYNEGGWDYIPELIKFVDGGMKGTGFIDAVSGIVNRGCHNPPCGTGPVDGGWERAENFKKVLRVLFDGSTPHVNKPSPNAGNPTGSGGQTNGPGTVVNPQPQTPRPTSLPQHSIFQAGTDSNPSPPNAAMPYPPPQGNSQLSEAGTGLAPSPQSIPITQPILPQQISPASEGGTILHSGIFVDMENALESAKEDIDNKLFLYKTPNYQWIPSSVYRYDDFKESLRVMATDGVAGKKFYIGERDAENGHVYGLVNIAAFLAQSMKETIQYDACDENSWDLVGGKYPLSNACGQLGQSYQDYHCSPEEAHMECPVDPNMSIVGVTHAKWYGAPGPLFCGPKTEEQPFSGFWDHIYQCDKSWANPPETCDQYEDQKAGRYDQSQSYANKAGRTDVEGCCWWGRGVIQTSGVCNFGKLNYYLGAGADRDGRPAKYPTIDFCKDPEAICASSEYKELKWIAGEFYWMESLQTYNEGGWDYITELIKFVDGGMKGTGFIDAVSGIVNRGCHNPPCGTGPVDGGWERSQNFKKVLDVLFGGSPPKVKPSPSAKPGTPTDTGPSDGSLAYSQQWYPDYNSQFSMGKCVRDAPIPNGRPTFASRADCCGKVYAGQSSGACLGALPDNSLNLFSTSHYVPGSSMADAFAAPMNLHARQKNDYLVYSCGHDNGISGDSVMVDILYDYEFSVPQTAQPGHLLPNLKNQIMTDLADTLGCQSVLRRNLRKTTEDEVLLGYHSAQGSDVIDGEKGSCSESFGVDAGEKCIPVIGHLAAFVQRDASIDAIMATKNRILHSIEDDMATSSKYSNITRHIVYVSEHGTSKLRHDNSNVGEFTESNTSASLAISFTLTVIFLFIMQILLQNKQNKKVAIDRIYRKNGLPSVVQTAHVSSTSQGHWDECSYSDEYDSTISSVDSSGHDSGYATNDNMEHFRSKIDMQPGKCGSAFDQDEVEETFSSYANSRDPTFAQLCIRTRRKWGQLHAIEK